MVAQLGIPMEEVKLNPASYVDPNGRVFEYRGEILRAIYPSSVAHFRRLFDKGIIHNLQDKRMVVETEVTQYNLDGYGLVLRHSKILPLSYCFEWPMYLLKKAALLTLDINLELLEDDLYLQDAYPWNILFINTNPVFVDLGSIVPSDVSILWPAYQQFCQFFLYPLHLASLGYGTVVRALLRNYIEGVTFQEFNRLCPVSYKMRHPIFFLKRLLPEILGGTISNRSTELQKEVVSVSKNKFSESTKTHIRRKFFEDLRREVDNIRLPEVRTKWNEYYVQKALNSEHKSRIVSKILDELRPESVLDIGCNVGLFSKLAAGKGYRTVAFDNDEVCINRLAEDVEIQNLAILPLVMDFANPSPAFGGSPQQFASAIERFQCRLVLALALVHHLVFHQRQTFERIVEALDAYATKWLVVEFVAKEDEYVQQWTVNMERFTWYRLENFVGEIQKRFSRVDIIPTNLPSRTLLLCEK